MLHIQGVYKFNEANFQENPGGVLRKIQDMFALLWPPLEGTPMVLWVFQLSVSTPQLNRNLGEHHKLPYRCPGRSAGRKRVLVHLELEKTHLMVINFVFLCQIFIHIFMTGNQSSIFDILYKNFQEDQLNCRRFPGFPGGFLNSRGFPGFPGVVNTLIFELPH